MNSAERYYVYRRWVYIFGLKGDAKGFNILYAILAIGSGLSQEITRFDMSTVNEHVRQVTATSSFSFFFDSIYMHLGVQNPTWH